MEEIKNGTAVESGETEAAEEKDQEQNAAKRELAEKSEKQTEKPESILTGIIERNRNKLPAMPITKAEEQKEKDDEKESSDNPKAKDNQAEENQQNEKGAEKALNNIVVTEEDAAAYGYLKTFVGKPVSEVMKAYDSLNREFTKRSQELKQYKTEIERISAEQQQQAEPEIDPAKDPEGYKAQQERKMQQRLQTILSPLLEQSVRREFEQMKENVTRRLPDDADVQSILREWKQRNEDHLDFYIRNPEMLVDSVEQFYKAEHYDELKSSMEKKISEEAAKKTSDALKKSSMQKSSSGANQTTVRPDEQQVSPTVRRIIDRNRRRM